MKKLLSSGLLVATALSLSAVAQAQQVMMLERPAASHPQIMSSQQVIVGPYTTVGVLPAEIPVMRIGATPIQVEIINPTSEAVSFNAPALNISQVVPPNTARIVYIGPTDVAGLTPGQQVAYYINDEQGNLLATSSLVYDSFAYQFTQVTESQSAIIEKPEPAACPAPPAKRVPVRGFW